MRSIINTILALAFLATPAFGQYTTITAAHINDAGGHALASGVIHYQATDGKGRSISFRLPGGGQATVTSVDCNVANGSITGAAGGGACILADTTKTNPINICYQAIISDNLTGRAIQGPGYSCFQPSGTSYSFDDYTPSQPSLLPVQTGPRGPIGPAISFAGVWSSPTTYAEGQAVVYSNQLYISLQDGNSAQQPDANPSYWSTMLTTGTVNSAPTAGQAVSQPAGTTMKVNNINSVAVINGDGSADNTVAIQAAVDACATSTTCHIQLVNTVIAGTINVPTTSNFNFSGVGKTSCVTAGNNCFQRTLTSGTNTSRWSFRNMTFVKATTGAVIADLMTFSSAYNQGVDINDSSFTLSGSAIGWLAQGTCFNKVRGNSFSSPFDPVAGTYPDRTGIAIQAQGSSGSFGAMITAIVGNSFNYLIGVKPVLVSGANNAWEGWGFTQNHFAVATVEVSYGNEINFTDNEFVNASFNSQGGWFNSVVSNNYFDSNVLGAILMDVHDLVASNAAIQITDNHFELSGAPNMTGVHFQGGHDMTGVTLMGNIYSGASTNTTASSFSISSNVLTVVATNSYVVGEKVYLSGFSTGTYLNAQTVTITSATSTSFTAAFTNTNIASTADTGSVRPISYGVWFEDNSLRNVYLAGENFRLTWSALHFTQTLDRSTIGAFEARDVFYYADGLPTYMGSYLIADGLYVKVPVRASGTLLTSGAAMYFGNTYVPAPRMFPGALTAATTTSCDTNVSANVGQNGDGGNFVFVLSNNSTTTGFHTCDVVVTFDGTKYVAPR